ncbi:MAG: YbgC/FadM family acyl-CoA thioesterase [Alphaproteobacteria bacterium]|nr:YbgC/FadM family acyl-CoA thioesterase [Alphaproteobacteria bacterium]MCB9690346.1 YbgC/FadM family acyl-CoA thioesterase [Alphaproteobacteria bacterium]
MEPHVHHVQIYYEDTDFSGVVYHPNYLKYFERAREHMLGVDALVEMWDRDGIGFVVYKCSLEFKKGARFGDHLEIRTTARREGPFRLLFDQQVWRADSPTALVKGVVEMVAVNKENQLVRLPPAVEEAARAWMEEGPA